MEKARTRKKTSKPKSKSPAVKAKGSCSVAEAAKILKLNPSRIKVLCAEGRIRATKIHDRLWSLNLASVKAFARSPRKPGKPKQ